MQREPAHILLLGTTSPAIHRLLEQEGYRISELSLPNRSKEALDYALIVMAGTLPASPADLHAKLKADPLLAGLPVLHVLDANTPSPAVLLADAYLFEPIRGVELKTVTATLLREQQNGQIHHKLGHDLRTPLNAMMGIVNIFGMLPLSGQQKEFVATLKESANDLLNLINSAFKTSDDSIEVHAPMAQKTANDSNAKSRVLLVEDYQANVLVATTLLECLGYEYAHAANGTEALEQMQNGTFDAVLMDIEMPDMNGYEATRKYREWEQQHHQGKRIPVIAMTAHSLAGDRDKCLAAGMDDYIAKPISADELEDKLQKYTAKHAA